VGTRPLRRPAHRCHAEKSNRHHRREIGAAFAGAEEAESGSIDLVLPIATALGTSDTQALPRTEEYPELAVARDPAAFVAKQRDRIAGYSRAIIAAFYT
jgi:hypothetical protein